MSSRKDYYDSGKRGSLDGVPIWRPKWWDELGNDAEFREATKPRTAFKAAYYTGGHRMTIDGIPVRLAGYVKDWAPWMKRALGKGAGSDKDQAAVEAQMEILWPLYGREKALERAAGKTSCVACHETYHTYYDHDGAAHSDCWHCTPAREGAYTQAQYDEARAA